MHVPPILPASMTMLAFTSARHVHAHPIPTPIIEGLSLDTTPFFERTDQSSVVSIPSSARIPSPPPMIQIFDPSGSLTEIVETGPGPQRTRRPAHIERRSKKPYSGGRGSRKPPRLGRSQDKENEEGERERESAVKQADRLAVELGALKIGSRGPSGSSSSRSL
ncbi:hypothetical protein NMY22_g6436 [Coprinellus aureogranulatus]|nr:hypothetical protein NMY22_g6436 [Coprinellus aureogranulatus]